MILYNYSYTGTIRGCDLRLQLISILIKLYSDPDRARATVMP